MILANANDLPMIVKYDHNHSFTVLATVITIVNYDRKTFIVQATEVKGSSLKDCCWEWWKKIKLLVLAVAFEPLTLG